MFFTGSKGHCEGNVTVVGEFIKIDGNHVILSSGGSQIRIQHNGLDNYKTKYKLVSGHYEDDVLVEENVRKLEEDFDLATYLRLSKVAAKYPEIF